MTEFARAYGGALYELALEEGLTAQLMSQLDVCADILARTPEYMRLLSAPSLTKETRRQAVDESFGSQVHPYLAGFLKLLVDRGGLRQFPGCVRAFRERYNQDNGILEVTVTTAVELSEPACRKLLAKLTDMFGKTILLKKQVDPAVLGGVRLECAGRRYDGTVADRLARIQRGLQETVL